MCKNLKSQKRISTLSSYATAFAGVGLSLPFSAWRAESLAAPGQEDDAVLYQAGCRQVLPVPEGDL